MRVYLRTHVYAPQLHMGLLWALFVATDATYISRKDVQRVPPFVSEQHEIA
jgi:hypothetical protein